jgi:calcium-dependent protein kinase
VRRAYLKSDEDMKFAIKSVPRENIQVSEHELEHEMQTLSKLDHINIAKVHQYFLDDHYLHVVMECVDGGHLFDSIVKGEHFTEKHAADVIVKMMAVVKYLHDHGIVYRNLQPDHFMLEAKAENPEIKLIDFGLDARIGI